MKRTWLTVALGATLLLSACGEAEKTAEPGAAPAPSAQKKDLTVGISNLGLSFPFPAAISKGIKDKAKELGVKVVEVDAQGKAEKQSNDVQDLIGRSPTACCCCRSTRASLPGWSTSSRPRTSPRWRSPPRSGTRRPARSRTSTRVWSRWSPRPRWTRAARPATWRSRRYPRAASSPWWRAPRASPRCSCGSRTSSHPRRRGVNFEVVARRLVTGCPTRPDALPEHARAEPDSASSTRRATTWRSAARRRQVGRLEGAVVGIGGSKLGIDA
jgi:hypothetical protein